MKRVVCTVICFLAISTLGFFVPKIQLPSSGATPASSTKDPLIGSVVSDVELTMLDGTSVKLADHCGKDVVVLDFWAGWCGPCRAALPKLQGVADEMAGSNVVFYAVNLRESAAAAEKTLKELGISIPAALDADGSLGVKFGVSGIPHTVIIDLEGRVWTYHSGYAAGMDDVLKAQIGMAIQGLPPLQVKVGRGIHQEPSPDVYQAKPLPTGDAVKLWRDLEQPLFHLLEREWMDVLNGCAASAHVSNDELKTFVSKFAKVHANELIKYKKSIHYSIGEWRYKPYAKQLNAWFDAGVDHPLLRYFDVLAHRSESNKKRRAASARRAQELMDEAGIQAPWIRYELQKELARVSANKPEKQKWRQKAKQQFTHAFHSDLYKPGEDPLMSNRLTTELSLFFNIKEKRYIADALEQDEHVPAFIALLADGFAHGPEAWEARGSGWASTVSKEGWLGFGEHLAEARKSLTKVWESHPKLPEAPWKMIEISMGHSIEPNEERKWFDRAAAARFDFTSSYFYYAWASTPRWGGSFKTLLSFGEEVLATGRFDTKVPMTICYCLKDIYRDSNYEPVVFKQEHVQKQLRQLVEGYRRNGGLNDTSKRALGSFVAASAVLGENYELAYEMLKWIDFKCNHSLLDSQMGVSSWKNYKVSAVLRGGPARGKYEAMHELWEAGSYAEAEEVAEDLQKTPGLSVGAKERVWIEAASLQKLQTPVGDWVSIFDRGSKVPWAGEKGQYWAIDQHGRLKANMWDMGLGWIPGQVSMVDGFELEFTLERESKLKDKNERSVLFFCRPEWHQYFPINVRFMCNAQKVSIDGGYDMDLTTFDCALKQSNRIRVVAKDSKIDVWVNGERIASRQAIDSAERCSETLWIGLGDYWSGRFRNSFRYSDIRLKRY